MSLHPSIVHHVRQRQRIKIKTFGALAAYLLIGMAFAFAYRFVGAESGPFFGASGDGHDQPTTSSSASSR